MPVSAFRVSIAGAGLLAAAVFLPAPADAQQPVRAYVTADLNQRAGPGTRFPVLVTVPNGNPVTLFGCLSDMSWCDGAYGNTRGWFSARYLTIPYRNTNLTVASYVRYAYLPTVAFNINSYWDRYYRDRPFYARLSFYADGGSVGVSVGSFYRPLARHGRWTEVRDRPVWVPRVGPGWRPYTEGRWVYTRRHGWTWVSEEPFGWATYHYGRWAYSPRIGWFWVPGTRWAPAWVAWRRSDDYVAWAPLPPDPDDSFGFSIDISFGNIPNYYWRPVRSRDFQSQNISSVVIGDNNTIINVINQTEPVGTVTVVNNVVVNNAIEVDYVEQQTGESVVARELALTAAEDGEITEEAIEIYHPPPEELEPADAPEEIASEEEIAAESATADQAGDEPATADLVPPAPAPDEAPPQGEAATEMPPIAEGEQPQEGPAAPEAAAEGPAPEGAEACPEGTVRQQDGSCAAPAAEAPPAEEVTPEIPAAPEVPEAAPEPQPVPAQGVEPPADGTPEGVEACPEGTVRQQDGSCAAPAAEAPPAEEVTPEAPAAPEVPEAAPEPQPAPAQPEQLPPPPQQSQEQPAPQQEAPPAPAPSAPEPQQPAPPPPEAEQPAPPPPEPEQPAPPPPEPEQPAPPPPEPQQQPAPPPPEPEPPPPPPPEPQEQPQACPEGQVLTPEGACLPQ